jgi:hypothetical protein
MHLRSKLPKFISMLVPDTMTDIVECSWNAFPHCRTEYHNAYYGEKFMLSVETMHANDRGTQANAVGLTPEDLEKRKVDYINIACADSYVKCVEGETPARFMSAKTGRGHLKPSFIEDHDPVRRPTRLPRSTHAVQVAPLTLTCALHSLFSRRPCVRQVMCCYKVVKLRFKVFALQSKVESWGQQYGIRNPFVQAHRRLFCWMDEWYGLTITDIRKMEDDTARITKQKIEESLRRADAVAPTS